MSPSYVLGLVFALIIVVTVFMTMRNSGLKERYGLWWYVIAFFTLILSVFPSILRWTALHTGVVVPLNLGFFVAGVALLLLSLRFSVDLSRSDEDRRRLTEEAAILRLQVEDLRRRVDALEWPTAACAEGLARDRTGACGPPSPLGNERPVGPEPQPLGRCCRINLALGELAGQGRAGPGGRGGFLRLQALGERLLALPAGRGVGRGPATHRRGAAPHG